MSFVRAGFIESDMVGSELSTAPDAVLAVR
jgi:hypothetical protein